MASLIVKKISRYEGLTHYRLVRWSFPRTMAFPITIWADWFIKISGDHTDPNIGVSSSAKFVGKITLPDKAYAAPEGGGILIGCHSENASGFEQAVLAFNQAYGNNKDIAINDVIWKDKKE